MATTGRIVQARKLLVDVAEKANASGERTISVEMLDRQTAFSTRQCCYAAQRNYIKEIERDADAQGIKVGTALREALLDGKKGEFLDARPAIWPGASILYRMINRKHYLVFKFRRINTDPLWADMIQANMTVGEPEPETLDAKEIAKEFK